jgi:hypothetical protein
MFLELFFIHLFPVIFLVIFIYFFYRKSKDNKDWDMIRHKHKQSTWKMEGYCCISTSYQKMISICDFVFNRNLMFYILHSKKSRVDSTRNL